MGEFFWASWKCCFSTRRSLGDRLFDPKLNPHVLHGPLVRVSIRLLTRTCGSHDMAMAYNIAYNIVFYVVDFVYFPYVLELK